MSSEKSPPGLINPTVNSYPVGAKSPATAAIAINGANNQKLQNINKMVAGNRRRLKSGGSSGVAVPVIKPIYQSQNGPGSDPTSQQAKGQTISMQSTANSVYDNQATKMGGSKRKYNNGGNPNWKWGCYSGGKKRTYRRTNKRKNKNKNNKKTKRRN